MKQSNKIEILKNCANHFQGLCHKPGCIQVYVCPEQCSCIDIDRLGLDTSLFWSIGQICYNLIQAITICDDVGLNVVMEYLCGLNWLLEVLSRHACKYQLEWEKAVAVRAMLLSWNEGEYNKAGGG